MSQGLDSTVEPVVSPIPTSTESTKEAKPVSVSLGIFAWNEELAIASMLESLLGQSLFAHLKDRGERAEIVCVLNGCTDRTALVAGDTVEKLKCDHAAGGSFEFRVADLAERGKVNAWNQYVHSLSTREAGVLFLMDADIVIHHPDTLWNMLRLLETDAEANIAVDRPLKDLALRKGKSVGGRLSLASAVMTQAAEAQLCAQLYAIRSGTARNIYLPKDLAACEDGFIKALVCTDFLTHEVWPRRLKLAPDASHIFEAYTSPMAVLRNQKRQVIGQTIVHLLVDKELSSLPVTERRRLGETIRRREAADPAWLKRLIREHLLGLRFFWRLYPGLLTHRFNQWRRVSGIRRLSCYPAALAALALAFVSSWRAYRLLKSGCTDYWPKAQRVGIEVETPAAGASWSRSPQTFSK